MLKAIKIATLVSLISCGEQNKGSSLQAAQKGIAPQGFVVGDYQMVSDKSSCNPGEKGARISIEPLDKSKTPFSSVTCYTSERVTTDGRVKESREHLAKFTDPLNETKYTFPEGTLADFCEQNEIEDFGALAFYDDFRRPRNPSTTGYTCKFDAEKTKKLIILNGENVKGFFDMRILRYLPNLVEIGFNTNAIVGIDSFKSPPLLKAIYKYFYGLEFDREQEQMRKILGKLPHVTFAEFHPAAGWKVEGALDVSVITQLPNLEALIASVSLKDLDKLKTLQSLKAMEITKSEDQFTDLPEGLKMLRYEVDTTSAVNWQDQKKFFIKSFRFEEKKDK